MSTSIIVLTRDKQPFGAIDKLTLHISKGCPKLDVTRMRLSREKLAEMFKDDILTVQTQYYPFHIVVLEDNVETIRATNVWITELAAAYKTDEWILAEGVELECEFVTGIQDYESSASE